MEKDKSLDESKINISNTLKMLLYKQQPALIQKVDFDNDDTFLEPILLAYFREKEACEFPNEMIAEYLQGYFLEKEEIQINHILNHFDVAYLPEIGYVRKGQKQPFAPLTYIEDTSIELLKYPLPIFKRIMETVPEETQEHYDRLHVKYISTLTNAIHYMRKSNPSHFSLIERCCKRILIFNTDPSNSNSFATRKANSIAFLNAYQEDYDEVFFVDDIAHQTGHMILMFLFFDPKVVYKIDELLDVEDLIGKEDHRTIDVLVHALYTYYTTFICLDSCLEHNCFTKEEQRQEALGRIGFYLWKCKADLEQFKEVEKHFSGLENMFTEMGMNVMNTIVDQYEKMHLKWGDSIAELNYKGQSYNFNRSTFFEMNKFEHEMVQ